MVTFLISTLVIGLVIAGMAVGVIMGRSPIKGSCGGMGSLGIDTACDLCGGNPRKCEEETRSSSSNKARGKLFFPADKS